MKLLKGKKDFEISNFFYKKQFIRHQRIGPDPLLSIHKLSDQVNRESIDARTELMIDHLIGVRSCVIQGLGWSCVPRVLVNEAIRSKQVAVVNLLVVAKRAQRFIGYFF